MNATDCEFFRNITNSTICSDNEPQYERPNGIVVGALLIMCIWIILTNGVVVICLVVSKELKKNLMNTQVLSLSFTDFLVGVSSLIIALNYLKPRSLNSYGMCTIVFGFYLSAQIASFYHTFCICLHRFVTVFCSLKSSRHNAGMIVKNTMIPVLIVWFVACMIAFIPFFVVGRWDSTLNVCSLNWLFLDKYNVTLSIWNISLLAPQIVINIMYISIYLKLRITWTKVVTIPNSTAMSTSSNTMKMESVSKELKELKLFNKTKLSKFKTDNMLKVSKQRPTRPPYSQENSQQQLPPMITKQQESTLQSGTKNSTILNSHANIPSCSQHTVEHDSSHKHGSADKSSNEVYFVGGNNRTRQSIRQPLGSQVSRSRNTHTKHRDHSKILVTIGLVLFMVDICLTPLNLLFILESLHEGFLSRKTKFMILILSLFNSGINPIIYAFRIEQLRQSVKKGYRRIKIYFVN